MKRYWLSMHARKDLKAIYRYIAAHNASAAGNLRRIFYKKFELLAAHPLLGEACDHIVKGIRTFPAGNYVIFYRPGKTRLEILHIIHAARDYAAVIRHRDE